jgi:hypothetical protein
MSMRADLAVSLSGLQPSGRLYACYSSEDRFPCDAENILFYNVGPSRFAALATQSLSFERTFSTPTLSASGAAYPHHILYTTRENAAMHWAKDELIAEWWTRLLPKARGTPSFNVEAVWLQMTRATGKVHGASALSTYGLRVEIVSPRGVGLSLASLVKRVFDGVISGLHTYSGSRQAVVSERLAPYVGLPASDVATLLTQDRLAVLGPREVVWPYRNGVQWNPADDRCLQGVFLSSASDADEWLLKGEIYSLTSR